MTFSQFLAENPGQEKAAKEYAVTLAERRRVLGILEVAGIKAHLTHDIWAMLESGEKLPKFGLTENVTINTEKPSLFNPGKFNSIQATTDDVTRIAGELRRAYT